MVIPVRHRFSFGAPLCSPSHLAPIHPNRFDQLKTFGLPQKSAPGMLGLTIYRKESS
jgi:hypothetical protein